MVFTMVPATSIYAHRATRIYVSHISIAFCRAPYIQELAAMQKEDREKGGTRNLQARPGDTVSLPENFSVDRTAQDFLAPCKPLPLDPAAAGWVPFGPNDDLSLEVPIAFDFRFYDRLIRRGEIIYINNNGNISFDTPYSQFTAVSFPTDVFQMIAPFWADVDTRERGDVWYYMDANNLIVTWDRVSYYFSNTDKANTFQLVIARDPDDFSGRGNVCFCYADMDWTTGDASDGDFGFGGTPATVGINRGNSVDFVQFGLFDKPGTAHDGGYGNTDGVDYLDDNRLGLPDAFCLDVASTNVPPVFLGFPAGETMLACEATYTTILRFLTPEPDQTVSFEPPTNLPAGMVLTPGGTPTEQQVIVQWTPTVDQTGTYNLEFTATDSLGGTSTATLILVVPTCAAEPRCEPLSGAAVDQCNAFNPSPFCEPYNSPEYCPVEYSFPAQLAARNEIFRDDKELIYSDGYWFPYLNDKSAAYAFTAREGYASPDVLCCATSVDDLMDNCLPRAGPLVVRAASLHSGNGVFVFPTGIGGTEALRGITIDMPDLRVALEALGFSGTYLLEEYIPGTSGPTSLPVEYKFHVFNGMIGAITVVYNRASENCKCVAEIDADGNRLDTFGCFLPIRRGRGERDGECFRIDFDAGFLNLGGGKNGDTCSDPLPDIPSCVFDYMKSLAEDLGGKIGVYSRIDLLLGAGNIPYVNEYSINHHGARKHCWSRQDPSGCIDSCFMGRLWFDKSQLPNANSAYGGPRTPVPSVLTDWHTQSSAEQCALVNSSPDPATFSC